MPRRTIRRTATIFIGLALALLPALLPAQPAQTVPAQSTLENNQTPGQYTLPPDKLQKAIEYSRDRYWLHFAGELYGIAILAAILAFGVSARFRNWAETASRRRFLQAVAFVTLLMLAIDVLNLPVGIYGQHLELAFDQSVQSWPSWFWDWTKGELLEFALAALLVLIL